MQLPCQPKIEAIADNLQSPAPQPNDDDDDDNAVAIDHAAKGIVAPTLVDHN